ncbi:hypothetical protein Poli38472_007297 [Pythium oligandrum]|uniref:Heme haloperoxidase family profile domain-containing protein n=1 Tax=Pythium oligandrum TaxID=41045 RepID=A0A8K1C9P6_PYTOL|nr:hypothetical protein Poli38472_007297 [Pythium oligandrum]|eukprot:TMW59152.1 hypothetical protein Poli38472_007297 [Pythium oligandrum]
MVSVYAFAAAAVALVSTTNALQSEVIAASLPEGEYYRPTGDSVSGRVDATTPFRRTPCPGLNALANHGYLPRDGLNVKKTELKAAVMKYYNIDDSAASTLTSTLPETFDLNYLGTHGFIEHDASLAHADTYFGKDPAAVDSELLEDMYSRFTDEGVLGVQQLGELRKDRLASCKAQNPNCTFVERQVFLAYGETAFLLNGLGDIATNTIDKDTFQSFVEFERIPEGFERPTQLTAQILLSTSAKVQAAATAAAKVEVSA